MFLMFSCLSVFMVMVMVVIQRLCVFRSSLYIKVYPHLHPPRLQLCDKMTVYIKQVQGNLDKDKSWNRLESKLKIQTLDRLDLRKNVFIFFFFSLKQCFERTVWIFRLMVVCLTIAVGQSWGWSSWRFGLTLKILLINQPAKSFMCKHTHTHRNHTYIVNVQVPSASIINYIS